MSMQSSPNLFLVGFQKCGSSAFYKMLCEHPQIKGTTPKETFYLTDKEYENYDYDKNIANPNSDWSLFIKESKPTQYVLEASVCNFYQTTALEYIKAQPAARVIFIMRDPVERFISNYKYYSGNIPKLKGELSLPEYYEQVKAGAYQQDSLKYAIEHGRYANHIEKWKSELGEDRVQLVSFKKMIKEPNVVLREICDFLELEYKAPSELKKVNASKKIKNKKLHSLLIKYFSSDFPLKSFLKKMYYGLFATKSKVEVDESFKQLLSKEYSKEYDLYKTYF